MSENKSIQQEAMAQDAGITPLNFQPARYRRFESDLDAKKSSYHRKHLKMSSEQRYSAEQVVTAIQQSKGNVSAAARALRCSRKTLMAYVDRYATVRQALDEEREAMIDTAESALYAAILDKEGWAVCFTLKTIGKSRGYVERQEITGADNTPLQINIVGVPSREAPPDPDDP